MIQLATNFLPISTELKNKLRNLIESLSWEMADKNIFPIDIINSESFLSDSLGEIKEILSEINWNQFYESIKETNPFLFHYNDFYKGPGPLYNFLMNDLQFFYIKNDDYVDINLEKAKVEDFLSRLGIIYDKEGLITINDEFKIEPQGVIFRDNHLIYLHQFLRRLYSANFLIGYTLRKIDQKKVTIKILPDPYRLTEKKFLKDIYEADYWFGEKFDESKLNNHIYVDKITVHGRNHETNKALDYTYPLEKTVFRQTQKAENLTQLEVEEIIPADGCKSFSNKYVFQKYCHMIWEKNRQKIVHLDFSVMVYKTDQHKDRIKENWSKTISSFKPKEIKVLKLEGILELEESLKVVYEFFRYNELVQEYFELE